MSTHVIAIVNIKGGVNLEDQLIIKIIPIIIRQVRNMMYDKHSFFTMQYNF